MKVEYVDWGIGNNYGDTIELNVNLKQYPILHRYILDHELGHDNSVFSFKELGHDLKPSGHMFELAKFMVKHPKSFSQFLPIYPHKKYGLVYDLNLMIVYASIIVLILIGIFLAIKI